MAVREADGDSTAYFRTKPDNEYSGVSGQQPFAQMSEYQLTCYVAEEARWANGAVPSDYDSSNHWGGQYATRQCVQHNAKMAKIELRKRGLNPA